MLPHKTLLKPQSSSRVLCLSLSSSTTWHPHSTCLMGLRDGSWRVLNQDLGRMREKCPLHCGSCLPYPQSGVWFGAVMQEEDLIHLPV